MRNRTDIELEEVFLWRMIHNPLLLQEGIGRECFYSSANRKIYEAIANQIRERGLTRGKIDLTGLRAALDDDDKAQLVACAEQARSPYPDNVVVETLKERWLRRQLTERNQELGRALEDAGSVEDICEEIVDISRKINRVTHGDSEGFLVPRDLDQYFSYLEELDGTSDMYLKTHMPQVDSLLGGGLESKTLTTIAGATGMGKTSLALAMVKSQFDAGQEVKTLFISGEMSREKVMQKLVTSYCDVDLSHLQHGLTAEEWTKLSQAMQTLQKMPLRIVDRPLTLTQVQQEIQETRTLLGGLDLVIIDYLQIMRTDLSKGSRALEIGAYTNGLVQTASLENLRIIQLAQVNRNVESRQNKRPGLSDLRESGSIEQDSSYVLLVYRDEYYNPETADRNMAEVILAKNRFGATGKANVLFFEGEFLDREQS